MDTVKGTEQKSGDVHKGFRSFKHYHPAYRRLPKGRPLAECQPINHPRGKDGTWR